MYLMPERSAMAATSAAALVASLGYRTVEPWMARIMARSSSPICDGPSAPISMRAGEERRERGGKRPVTPDTHADRSRDHLLLGDEHLEIPRRMSLRELLGKG